MTLQDLPAIPKRERTYLEILKIHNREVPMANLLRYLSDPAEEHGLGDLFIRSLLETVSYDLDGEGSEILCNRGYRLDENFKVEKDCCTFEITGQLLDAMVKTEEGTANSKRIDLVITGKEFIIVIEFKINHSLNNPLDIYKRHFEEKINEGKTIFFVVLTPYRKKIEDTGTNKVLEFRQVVLTHFVEKIKQNKLLDITDKRAGSFIYNDFITTIENRTHQKKIRDAIVKFGYEDIAKTLSQDTTGHIKKLWEKEFDRLKSQMVSKVKDLKKVMGGGSIKTAKNSAFNYFLKIPVNNRLIKVRLTLEGWTIELWVTDADGTENQVKEARTNTITFETNTAVIASKVLAYKKEKADAVIINPLEGKGIFARE